jgi:6-phosphofructokinase 1
MMNKRNAFYAQSGGVTAVINASAAGVIETARRHRTKIGKVYAGRNGIIGALTEDLIDTSRESARAIAALKHTPGGAFGSCRYKLKGLPEGRAHYERLLDVFRAHDIGYFFYNAATIPPTRASRCRRSPKRWLSADTVHVPRPSTTKPVTDNCPGFDPSPNTWQRRARAAFDVASMAKTSTRVFVLEVMGRNAGWITAAVGMADDPGTPIPLVLLFPEVAFDEAKFLARVDANVKRFGYCCVGVSEGLKDAAGALMAEAGTKDAFGHAQLGGVGPLIASIVKDKLKHKYHWAVADYLQRAARSPHRGPISTTATRSERRRSDGDCGQSAVMPAITRV